MPLGLVTQAMFQSQTVIIPPGGKLLFFTDGLTDGIGGERPEDRVCEAMAHAGPTISNLRELLNAKFNDDDITILLLTRRGQPITVETSPLHPLTNQHCMRVCRI
jgi:serine phosphatase RsbU (regulator of sigma subunit)